ncbi:MAG: hypothetical protein EB084_25840 [Proteobacteria bacterium]|jgi:hypothetical protein|nr:hypothetical protein [Pseudomonadota bacterium]
MQLVPGVAEFPKCCVGEISDERSKSIVLLRWNPGWVATAVWIGREVTGATSAPEDARDGRFADAEEFPDALVGMPATLIRLDK